MKVSVVIPVYNERAFIEEVLLRVQAGLAADALHAKRLRHCPLASVKPVARRREQISRSILSDSNHSLIHRSRV